MHFMDFAYTGNIVLVQNKVVQTTTPQVLYKSCPGFYGHFDKVHDWFYLQLSVHTYIYTYNVEN